MENTFRSNELSETVLNDPVLLRIAIRQCRLDCAEAERRIKKFKEDHHDFVPKADFVKLKENYEELLKNSEQLKQKFRNTKVEYNALIEALETLIQDRDKYFDLYESYRATLTPRPEWDRCASVVERWNELTIGKTSNERVDILLNEIIGGNDIFNNVTHFLGLGLDPSIPEFLRTTNRIRNRHFMKRDVLLLIEDIWKQKISFDRSSSQTVLSKRASLARVSSNLIRKPTHHSSLADFVHIYLKQRFTDEFLQLEWAYNLIAGCQRFQHSSEIRLFWQILRGEIDESMYHETRSKMNDSSNLLEIDSINE